MKQKISLIMVAFVFVMFFSMFSAVAVQGAQTYIGYLADILCVDSGTAADGANMAMNPQDHTVMCALMKPCIKSGYTLLVKNPSGGFDSLPLNKKGNKLAVKYLKNTDKTDNIYVTITGTMMDNMIQVDGITDAQ